MTATVIAHHLLGRTPERDAYSALMEARARLFRFAQTGATREELREVYRLLRLPAQVLGDELMGRDVQ